jgi:hypothetical protein
MRQSFDRLRREWVLVGEWEMLMIHLMRGYANMQSGRNEQSWYYMVASGPPSLWREGRDGLKSGVQRACVGVLFELRLRVVKRDERH